MECGAERLRVRVPEPEACGWSQAGWPLRSLSGCPTLWRGPARGSVYTVTGSGTGTWASSSKGVAKLSQSRCFGLSWLVFCIFLFCLSFD